MSNVNEMNELTEKKEHAAHVGREQVSYRLAFLLILCTGLREDTNTFLFIPWKLVTRLRSIYCMSIM